MPVAAHSAPVGFQQSVDTDIVITGVGIITAMGHGWQANADGFRAGRVAIRPVTVFDVTRQAAHIAAEVDLPATLPANSLGAAPVRRL
ncbi:MAG: hypothetical protein RLZZ282_72, partial [Verrucomicrobiota bacterium]